jgi:hypothetical protein
VPTNPGLGGGQVLRPGFRSWGIDDGWLAREDTAIVSDMNLMHLIGRRRAFDEYVVNY